MKTRRVSLGSGFAMTALIGAAMIIGVWLYMLKADIPGQIRGNEEERCALHFSKLQSQFLNDLNDWAQENPESPHLTTITRNDRGEWRGNFIIEEEKAELLPPDAQEILLYNLERQGQFAKAVTHLDDRGGKLSGNLVLLKARCLRRLGRLKEASQLLAKARHDQLMVAGPFSFSTLSLAMESKMLQPQELREFLSEIARFEIPMSAEDALKLADIVPDLKGKQFATFLTEAKVLLNLRDEGPASFGNKWQRHNFAVARFREDTVELIDLDFVDQKAKKIAQLSDSNFSEVMRASDERVRVSGPLLPSKVVLSLGPQKVLAGNLVHGLMKILPVVAIFLAIIGIWIYLRDLRREIEVAQLKSRFIDVVTHELRTPLTVVGLKTEMLANGTVPQGKLKAYAQDTHAEVGKLQRLLERLLDFKQLDEGGFDLRKGEISAVSLLRGVMSEFEKIAPEREFVVLVPDQDLHFEGDQDLLGGALRTLVENALKYAPSGSITLRSHLDSGRIRLQVEDLGPGVPKMERGMIFDRFSRGQEARKGAKRGLGLGLAFVKLVAQAHEGTCGVEARTDGLSGAMFFLEVPKS